MTVAAKVEAKREKMPARERGLRHLHIHALVQFLVAGKTTYAV